MKLIVKRTFIVFLTPLVLFALLLASVLVYHRVTRNIHVVIPGQIYRSAQLNHAYLKTVTQRFHIQSIINLRGPWETNHWYRVEQRFTRERGIHYYSIRFSAYYLPSKEKIRTLVHILQIAPKPLILHCEGGADRTGMASAISLILFKKDVDITEIKAAISWRYNVISSWSVGYQMLRNYFAWLKKNHLSQSRSNFLKWLYSNEAMKPYHGFFL